MTRNKAGIFTASHCSGIGEPAGLWGKSHKAFLVMVHRFLIPFPSAGLNQCNERGYYLSLVS